MAMPQFGKMPHEDVKAIEEEKNLILRLLV